MSIVYMDNNATTRVDPLVFEVMLPYFKDMYGNPSSMHTFGGQVGRNIAEARDRVAALVGCEPGEVLFTSCGTEGDNTAIRSALESFPGKHHIVTTKVEHPAVLSLCKYLEKHKGYRVTYLSVDEKGQLDMREYERALTPDTAIVSIMWANNETGTIFPIEETSRLARERGILFHTDAVQVVGKIPIDFATLDVDFLTISGHKLHAPKGVGVQIVRRGVPFRPFLVGGHQERGRRGGTENTASIVAMGKACEVAGQHLEEENSRVRELRDSLEQRLMEAVPKTRLNGHPDKRLPNTVNLSFEHVEGEAILLMLDQFGICASSGSACTSGSLEPSHVLRAMGVPFTYAHGSIRFSLSRFNTMDDVDHVVAHLPGIIHQLREISPFKAAMEKKACTC